MHWSSTSRVIATALLTLCVMLGCAGNPGEDYLGLSWEEFDQNPNSGWRPVAANEDYAGAAAMIERYLEHHDDLSPAQRGYSTFHAGQLWALHGETTHALTLLDKATVENMPSEFPRAFNALVVGTRAFLRGDMETVRGARDEVAALADRAPRDEEFLEALDLLTRSDGLTYRQVYARALESR